MFTRKSGVSVLAIMLVAVAIIGGVSSYFMFRQQPETQIVTTTSAATTLPRTQTTTQPRLFRVYGRLFFDYNGNGKQDHEEPDMPNVVVALDGRNVTATDSTGWYVVDGVVEGNHAARPYPPKDFRYMCRSASEFRSTKESYAISVTNDSRVDIGLMEGYLTLPFAKNTTETGPRTYVDVDLRDSYMRDWQGGRNTYDNHLGTDYDFPIGTMILAAAPGQVTRSYYSEEDGNAVTIEHPDGKFTIYCHLSERKAVVGQRVSRGDIIGLSGHTGKYSGPRPHLHFQYGGYGTSRIDPYRDLLNPTSLSHWTKDNDPQFFV